MKNQLPVAATVRQPRAIIRLNGTPVAAYREWENETNAYYQADTFRASFAEHGLPAALDANWFATQTVIEVEILVGFPPNPAAPVASDLDSIFFGRVDDLMYDPVLGVIEITGRDLTSVFIDTKTSEKYVNLTASEVATKLANAHGLTPVVTATKTKVGRYYQIDRVRLQDDRTEWDLLTWLAREEGFICYVKGKELHFEPKPTASADPYVFKLVKAPGLPPSGNFKTLQLSHNLTVAKDIRVTVRSWNPKQKKAFAVSATAKKNRHTTIRTAVPATPVQEYSYTIPNLTVDQAQQRANQILAELSKHEMKAAITGPADNLLQITDPVQIAGTGTAWDQTYFPDAITRSMSFGAGYEWRIQVKNHAPDSEPTI